jgi:cell division protein FtsZ
MALNLTMPEQDDLKPRITVFGVGGAGGNAVDNMIEKELEGVEFVVANTDAQALQQSKAPVKIQMGLKVTEGLGAGAKATIGAAAAEESIEQIVDQLAGAHMCFITAGMGGGTGTGAAPIIAQAARELGVLTVGVVTKPFQFEGSKRMRQAEEGVEALQKVVDTLIIIPNQNLFRLANESTTFTDAFSMADDVLYQGVKGVTDLMVRPGLINLDFADVRAVMDEMGKAMMGTGEANGGADLTLFELDEAANRIREEVDPDANIIVGSTLDTTLEGVMRVSVVATGIDADQSNHASALPSRRAAAPMEDAAPEADHTAEQPVALEFPFDTETEAPSVAATETAQDEIPAPAYQPQLAEPEQIVVPEPEAPAAFAPAAPGTPTPEAMARLRAAVERVPETAEPRMSAEQRGFGEPAAPAKGKFGINSLINRMTGQGDSPASEARSSTPSLGQQSYEGDETGNEADERIEIPAFLRRQAN